MCGIFGFCGNSKIIDKNLAKAIKAKVKILGMFNVERGKHSCGLYINNSVIKGVDKDKIFTDFITNNEIPDPMDSGNFTMIGHTRMATNGIHNYDNAHPFIVDENFVLAHNGVIRNIWPLCNKYKVDHTKIHVDSLGLAHLINKEGFKILNEYEGFAALLMAKADEPNSLYIYRGVSKRSSSGTGEEERPLFYMISEEGIYVSSLESSLLAISDEDNDKIHQVEANTVLRITEGILTDFKFHVNRDLVNLGVSTNTNGGSPTHNFPKGPSLLTNTCGGATNCHTGKTYERNTPVIGQNDIRPPLIWFETIPERGLSGNNLFEVVFYHTGRYWIADGDEITMAHGGYHINRKGKVLQAKISEFHNIKECHKYYFYQGIMVKDKDAYSQIQSDPYVQSTMYNFACMASKYTLYPVFNLPSDLKNGCKNASEFVSKKWYLDQAMVASLGFIPKWSDRNYTIKDGVLMSIGCQKGVRPEECIDREGYKQELIRLGKDKVNVDERVIAMNQSFQQRMLPFVGGEAVVENKPKVTDVVSNAKMPEFDLTNFYRVFPNLGLCLKTLTDLELRALKYYIADIMYSEMSVCPESIHEDSVEVQTNLFLNVVIENNATIIDTWDESTFNDLLHYLTVAYENPDGRIVPEDVVENSNFDVCEMVPKPDQTPGPEWGEQGFHEAYGEYPTNLTHTNEEIVEVLDADTNEWRVVNPIDEMIAAEQARVPRVNTDEKVRTLNDMVAEELFEEELDHTMRDIVDFLFDTRDCGDELTAKDTVFCDEIAHMVYRGVDPLLRKILDMAESHGKTQIVNYIKQRSQKMCGL